MAPAKLRIMWCAIILVVAALLYMPHRMDITQPVDGKIMTPAKADRVQNYVGVEMFIVALLMAGGGITIRSAAMRATKLKNEDARLEPAQKDAKPSIDEPLLVLTDERGKFVV
jgi:hypothetical protein